ncbi:DUF4129 domain-containing protein [Actinophytocola sp.]|uniref:DUF4129 domain-containing protein n=1 Tax=Actinophytocola sp. TaxID=1872138 RepID=UPI003899FBEB
MRGSRLAMGVAVAAFLLLGVLVARGDSGVPGGAHNLHIDPGLPYVPLQGGSGSGSGMQYSVNDPALFARVVIGIAAVMVLLAVVLSVLSWLRIRRRVGGGVNVPVDSGDGTVDTVMRLRLKDAVAHARDLLTRAGGEPRDAVIRAWATLENATEHGRAPHQTATEFTVSLLAKETTDEAALDELRTLYHRARFGHDSGEREAEQARTALDRILATIR